MLLIVDFWRDLVRFRRHGLLSRALYSLFVRSELLVWLSLAIAIGYYSYNTSPIAWAATVFLYLLMLHFLFVSFVVKYLTPLYFGEIAFARLDGIEHWAKPGPLTTMNFFLLPAALSIGVNIMGVWPVKGKVGRVYLVLLHPRHPDVFLPIIDDDPMFYSYLSTLLTDNTRRCGIRTEVARLRASSGYAHS